MPDDVVPGTEVIRFTYALDAGGALALADAVAVSMTTLPSHELDPDFGPYGGFRYELRDAGGAVLWRHITQHPLRGTIEIHGEDGSVALSPDEVGAPLATIAVPALPGAATVALVGAPGDQLDAVAVDLLVHPFASVIP